MKTIFAAVTIALSSVVSAQVQSVSVPKSDAPGTPVASAPSIAPVGANSPVTIPPGGAVHVVPEQAAAPKPIDVSASQTQCSRKVKHHCVQRDTGGAGAKSARRAKRVRHH